MGDILPLSVRDPVVLRGATDSIVSPFGCINLKVIQVDAAETAKPAASNYIEVVADLVSAYVSNN